ncbi:signal transduction histidine kinase [Fusobacterium sp. PH5-44]
MVYILSILLVLIEASLPLTNYLMVMSLSFLAYTSNLKGPFAAIWIVIISLILSFQNTNFTKIFIIMVLAYFIFNFLYLNFGYNRGSVLFISGIQVIIYLLFTYNNLNIYYIIANFVGFLTVNFVYTRKRIE